MTAREFFKLIDGLPLDHRLSWSVPNTTGFLFYKFGHPYRYFITKQDARTKFDVLRFVAIHNIEDYNVINSTEPVITTR